MTLFYLFLFVATAFLTTTATARAFYFLTQLFLKSKVRFIYYYYSYSSFLFFDTAFLKKISVQDIADKINQTKKRTFKKNDDQTKPQIKQPLPQFGKSISKKKLEQ